MQTQRQKEGVLGKCPLTLKKKGGGAICCGKTPQMKWILSVSCYCLGYSGSAEDCVFGPNSQRFDKPDTVTEVMNSGTFKVFM